MTALAIAGALGVLALSLCAIAGVLSVRTNAPAQLQAALAVAGLIIAVVMLIVGVCGLLELAIGVLS